MVTKVEHFNLKMKTINQEHFTLIYINEKDV